MDKWSSEMIKVMIFFIVMAFVTSGLLYFAIREWRSLRRQKKKAVEMQTWSTTTASARDWKVRHHAGFRGKYKGYKPEITYQYHVGHKAYIIQVYDKKIYIGFDTGNDDAKAKQEAEVLGRSIVEQAKQVEIFYNPADPAESAAELDDVEKISFVGIAIVIVVLCFFLLVFVSLPLVALGMVGYALFLHFAGG